MTKAERITLFDVYASQRCWSHGWHLPMTDVDKLLGLTMDKRTMGCWNSLEIPANLDLYEVAAEIAQRLREGCSP